MKTTKRQLPLELPSRRRHGGKRHGAGRPRIRRERGVPHRARRTFSRRVPAHVTMKLLPDVGQLRTKRKVQVVRQALTLASDRFDTRVIHWSVQSDHIHIVCEPGSQEALAQAMQGLAVRVAKGLNRVLGRRGTVFEDRYHVRVMRTPRQVRNTLAYVLNNARRHGAQRGYWFRAGALDRFSSAAWFDGWKDVPDAELRRLRGGSEPPVAHPATWLLSTGWRGSGLISSGELPGACRKSGSCV